jgi:hypothetical protein
MGRREQRQTPASAQPAIYRMHFARMRKSMQNGSHLIYIKESAQPAL